ncbi:polymorphic toxin type 44 domain-containing protein [Pseudomonas sp. NPDC087639]|uniref:polymorphic toxin type 44 domain-containing protein n=1 Tax=Pseudomonas sp. NPDC087639 TaxID=3364445 RepID=UPI0038240381
MISSARLGDKHVCPLPGHGTTPIASASADTNINFMGSARVGDACGCGAVIITGFPSILVNGRPMAHLGSPTSHGGTIITGSGDVGGGFVMGGAGGATIINFMALGAIRPNGTVDEEKMATLLADPQLKEKAVAANALVDPGTPKPEQNVDKVQPAACNHPDQMEPLADYIAGEMNRNILSPEVSSMQKLYNYDPASPDRKPSSLKGVGPPAARLLGNYMDIAAAWTIWASKVGPRMDWDHKPKLRKLFVGVYHKQGAYDYFYDIWSNIHYGYVGVIAGMSESELLDGAGVAQLLSDAATKAGELSKPEAQRVHPGPHTTASPWYAPRSWDDVADRVSIQIGIKLAEQYPAGGVTAKMIMDEVVAIPPESWGDGIRAHNCQ